MTVEQATGHQRAHRVDDAAAGQHERDDERRLMPSPRCNSCGTKYMNAKVQANEQLTMMAGVRNAAMPSARRSSNGSAMCS